MKSKMSKEDEINKRLEIIMSLIKVTPNATYFNYSFYILSHNKIYAIKWK